MKSVIGILFLILITQPVFAIDSAAIPLCRVSKKQLTETFLSQEDPRKITTHKRRLIHDRISIIDNVIAHELTTSSRPLYQSVDLPYNVVSYRIKEIIASMNDDRISINIEPTSLKVEQGKISFKIIGTLKNRLLGEGEEEFSQMIEISNSATDQVKKINNQTIKYAPTTFKIDGQDFRKLMVELGFETGYAKTSEEISTITHPVTELDRNLKATLKENLSPECYDYLLGDRQSLKHRIVDFNRGNGELYRFSKSNSLKRETNIDRGFSVKID